jgi:predicted phosphodiesterase
MRLALLADIHGNPIALDAVLADIQSQGGVDGYWCLGDYCAQGYDPVTPLERIAALPDAVFLRGNADRHVTHWDLDTGDIDPGFVPRLVSLARSFAWTQGYLTLHGWLDWLADLPLEHRATLPDGTRVLAVHASPGRDDGPGVTLATTPDELRAMVHGCEADLVVVGHTHWPQDHRIDDVRLINTGSISSPWAPDVRASYVLLDADDSSYQITFRRVAYDIDAVIEAVRQAHHPMADAIISDLRGERRADWL